MQIRKLKILNILLFVGVYLYCKPKSESGIDSNLWPLIQNSIENQQKCQLPNAVNSNSAQCFQSSTSPMIYNVTTSSLIPIGTSTLSVGTKLQCKCPDSNLARQNSWYLEADANSKPITISHAPNAYYTNNQMNLENYSVGDVLYCALSTASCNTTDYLYQKIRIVP